MPSPAERHDHTLEQIESRQLSPAETAQEMKRAATQEISDVKANIDQLRASMQQHPELATELNGLQAEVDAAWDELNADIESVTAPPVSGVFEKANPSEELDWDIPDTSNETTSELTEDQVMDAANAAIERAFGGDQAALNELHGLLQQEKTREIAERFVLDELGTRSRQMAQADPFDGVGFRAALELAAVRSEFVETLRQNLAEEVGSVVAEKMTNDPTYAERITGLERSLAGDLAPNGPKLMEQRSLKNLAALLESVGEHALTFANALDLRTLSSSLDYTHGGSVIEVDYANVDEETGELMTKVSFNINYVDANSTPNARGERDSGGINRNIYRNVRDGQVKTHVEHTLFRLPESVKDNGIASEVTRRSLDIYGADGMDLDEIKLHADIDAGGYVWASYGYGWDHDQMAMQLLSKKADKGEDITVGGREIFEYDELTEADRVELAREEIASIINGCRNTFRSILSSIARRGGRYPVEAAEQIEQQLEAALANPDVTPQHLAAIGDTAPRLFKGNDGQFYLEDEWPSAQTRGIGAEPGYAKKAAHIGKIALLGSDWHGKIELNANGPQSGNNLHLLRKTIARRPTPPAPQTV